MNTMDCADIKAILSGLVDDQVDSETRHLAERHIADCHECRDMLDEAEALDHLVAAEAEETFGGLPEGFEDGVFAKISEPDAPVITPYALRWTTWVGWVAAAASLALALSLWVMDRRASFPDAVPGSVAKTDGDAGTSTTTDGGAVTGVHTASLTRAPVFDTVLDPFDDTAIYKLPHTDEAFDPVALAPGDTDAAASEAVKEKSRELSAMSDRPTMSAEDAQTLYSASILLEMIAETDADSFADIESARQILEYDELLPRLAAVRQRLGAADRPVVLAAESVLTRIVRGPVDLDDVRIMRETVLRLNLASQFATLSDRGPWGRSA